MSFKATKTGNVRLVTVTTQAIEALREHCARAEANRGAPIGTEERIFTDDPAGSRPWNRIIDGDELQVDVNSDRRADEVIELVNRLLPDAELVDHDVRDVDEALDTHRASGAPPAANRLDDPEMSDARDEIIAEFERRWLDDHIPALGGRTPREAALDPTAVTNSNASSTPSETAPDS